MKIVKKILSVLGIIIVILLITALFLKKDYQIGRDVAINKPKDQVFNYVKLLRNQDAFSKWAKMDPNMKKSFKGTDGTVGFVSMWEGNGEVGKGEQEIKNISEGQSIDYEIRFKKPWESVAQSKIATEILSANQTKVTWTFSGHMPYPFNLMRLFGMEKMIGKDLQTGLDTLKAIQEKN